MLEKMALKRVWGAVQRMENAMKTLKGKNSIEKQGMRCSFLMMKYVTLITILLVSNLQAQFIYTTAIGSSAQPNGLINQYSYDGNFIKSFGFVTSDAGIAAGANGEVFSVNSTSGINKYNSAGQLLVAFGSAYGAGPIAYGAGYVYSVGINGAQPNGLINQYLENGTFVKSFGATTSNAGLAIGPDGSVFAVQNSVIRKYDFMSGNLLMSFGQAYEAGPLAVGPDGKIYSASLNGSQPNYKINEYSADGILLRTFGSIISDGGLAVGSDGSIYSVNGQSALNKYDSNGNFLYSFGQAYSAGQIAATVPEPSALSLLAVGLGGLAILRRRRS